MDGIRKKKVLESTNESDVKIEQQQESKKLVAAAGSPFTLTELNNYSNISKGILNQLNEKAALIGQVRKNLATLKSSIETDIALISIEQAKRTAVGLQTFYLKYRSQFQAASLEAASYEENTEIDAKILEIKGLEKFIFEKLAEIQQM